MKDKMTLDEFLAEWKNGSPRLLVHTSGSTGTPKPLWVEKSRMEVSARTTCQFLRLQQGDTALLCMPLDYIAGKMMVVRSLTCGLRLLSVPPSSHPLATLTEAPVFAAMLPMQVYCSLEVPRERDLLRNVRHLIIGGGAVDDDMVRQLSDFPHAVWSTYGMTETLSHIALRRLNGQEASEWYLPFDGVKVGLSCDGCLVIDAPGICAQPLVTNDRAELASDGRGFRIIGRKDNVICSGGIKIQAEEVERMLRPYLQKPFMITRQTDGKYGQAVTLLTESLDLPQVQSACRQVLPRYWCPRHVYHIDQIPQTETGKPARKKAEEWVCNWVARIK